MEEKIIQKAFRLTAEENEKLTQLIEYAYKAGYISEPSFQKYIIFALNCAYTKMKEDFIAKRGMP